MVHKVIIRVVSLLFLFGGIVHWLIILGVMKEEAPLFITLYFHSLAILDILTAYGLWFFKDWGRKLGLFIAITQIPSHGYMLFLELDQGLNWERIIDIAFAVFYLVYFQKRTVKANFN